MAKFLYPKILKIYSIKEIINSLKNKLDKIKISVKKRRMKQ